MTSPAIVDVRPPTQLDCPWCGCGWLFSCISCGKAFTFAEGVEVDFTLEKAARRALMCFDPNRGKPSSVEIQERMEYLEWFLEEIEPGRQYVYLDGVVIPADVDGVEFEGLYAKHDLCVVPQSEGLSDPSIVDELLGNSKYWLENRLPRDEEE